jgi:hypothetical protein
MWIINIARNKRTLFSGCRSAARRPVGAIGAVEGQLSVHETNAFQVIALVAFELRFVGLRLHCRRDHSFLLLVKPLRILLLRSTRFESNWNRGIVSTVIGARSGRGKSPAWRLCLCSTSRSSSSICTEHQNIYHPASQAPPPIISGILRGAISVVNRTRRIRQDRECKVFRFFYRITLTPYRALIG